MRVQWKPWVVFALVIGAGLTVAVRPSTVGEAVSVWLAALVVALLVLGVTSWPDSHGGGHA